MTTARTQPFGDLLRRHRIAAGFTQEELAERAGLSAHGIAELESGRRHSPRRDTVQLLADALQLAGQAQTDFETSARQRRVSAPVLPLPAGSASAGSLAPPLVGRDDELRLIERLLAADGPPLLVLAGEPGIGKTRLLREAAQRARAHGWTVLWGGCHRRSGQEPYAPLLSAIADCVAQRSLAQQRLDLRGCGWLARLLPELTETAGLAVPTWALSAEQERRLMFAAVGRFLANVAGSAGTFLVLDDLQWAGLDALDLLASLMRGSFGAPVRIVAAYRDTETRSQDALAVLLADLDREELAVRMVLEPLSREAATALLVESVGDVTVPDAMAQQEVLVRAGGVPYFLLSLSQGLRAAALAGDGGTGGLPRNVAEAIRLRVAALSQEAQTLLGAAAIAGRVTASALLLVLGMRFGYGEGAVIAALDQACQARLLTEQGGQTYAFTHDLVREAVTADMTAARRAFLHRMVAEALEQASGAPPVEALAYHYARGGMPIKAVTYLERAGDHARAVYAHAEAASAYQDLAVRLDELGRAAEAAGAREKLGAVLMLMARYDQALQAFEEAAEAYRAAGDTEGQRRTVAQIGWALTLRGTPGEGLARLRALLDGDGASAPTRGLAALYVTVAFAYFALGQYDEQLRACERAADIARALSDDRTFVLAEARRGQALMYLGRLSECIHVLTADVLPRAEACGDYESLWRALEALGAAYATLGNRQQQHRYITQGLAVAERANDPIAMSVMRFWRGAEAFAAGEWQRAHAEFDAVASLLAAIGMSRYASLAPLGHGWLALAEGDHAAATRYLSEAIQLAEGASDLGTVRLAHCALAERDLIQGHPDLARARLDALGNVAHHLAYDMDVRVLLAWAHLEQGDVTQANELIEAAIVSAASAELHPDLITALCVRARIVIHGSAQYRLPGGSTTADQAPSPGTSWGEAERALSKALALSHAIGYPYAEAKALYTSGLLHGARGDAVKARDHLTTALGVLRGLGERLYAEHVERALAALT